MKKQWTIEISQNGWEYIGTATITAIKVEKINDTTVLADGIEIEFNEEISFYEE
jgi:hypothetical protein